MVNIFLQHAEELVDGGMGMTNDKEIDVDLIEDLQFYQNTQPDKHRFILRKRKVSELIKEKRKSSCCHSPYSQCNCQTARRLALA
jgi:hypothetical protein